jgi:hypothetical protein
MMIWRSRKVEQNLVRGSVRSGVIVDKVVRVEYKGFLQAESVARGQRMNWFEKVINMSRERARARSKTHEFD